MRRPVHLGGGDAGLAELNRFQELTDELVAALAEEIEVLKQGGGTNRYALRDGRLVGRVAGRFLYAFLADSELSIPADSPAQLVLGSDISCEATVVAVEGFEVRLAVSHDLGERVPAATLVSNPYYLLEILSKRLLEAKAGRLPANRHLALALFNREPAARLPQPEAAFLAPSPSARPDRPGGQELDPKQADAIKTALEWETAFIWGPPGTGKTFTIARLVQELLRQGERVLITSHTNAAVDVAFKSAVQALSPEQVQRGIAVRVGTPQGQDPEVEENTLERVVERRAASLRAEQVELERRRDALEVGQRQLREALDVLEAVRQSEALLHKLREAQSQTSWELEQARSEALVAKQRVQELRARLAEAERAGWLRRLLTGMRLAAIREDLTRAEQQQRLVEERVARAQAEASRVAAQVRRAEQAYREAMARRDRLEFVADEPTLRRQLQEAEQALELISRRLSEIAAAIERLAHTVLQEARVVAATLSRLAIMEELHHQQFDTVVVDEASMVPLPSLWLAAMLARRRVVVAGDFRQLPPIAAAGDKPDRYPRACRWLTRDIFTEAGLLDSGRVRHEDPRLAALRRQRRMHPAIGSLVNKLVYERDGNPLEHQPEKVEVGLRALPEAGYPLVLCDTSNANPWCARPSASHSRYNVYSAVAAVRLAAQAASSGATVGLVAPYRAQVQLLQALAARYDLRDRVRVATVHRFQGDEQDVIVFDLVDGPPYRVGQLLSGPFGSNATRLLNVACSRARGKLVVVAHYTHLLKQLGGNDSLAELLNLLGQHGRWMDARAVLTSHDDRDVLAGVEAVRRAGERLPAHGEPTLCNEAAFYPAFRKDLAGSSEYVVLYSPFIHANRLADLMTDLRAAVERGVQVTVVTRPAGKGEGNAAHLLQEVQRAGLRVVAQRNLHEKLAIVDGRIAWFGSLNILSHSRTSEWMMRFSDPGFVGRLVEVTGAAALVDKVEREQVADERRRRLLAALATRAASPPCPACGRPTRLTVERRGPLYRCTDQACAGKVDLPRPVIQAAVRELALPCPACGEGRLGVKWGRQGAFLSCARYPECKWAESF